MTGHQRDKPHPKEAIFDAAVRLFAQKGYAATGVREIARAAGVNQAMLNYYFGSKIQLLEAIFELAFASYAREVAEVLVPKSEQSLEETVRQFFRAAITTMRRHRDVFRVTWSELHYEKPEIAEFKAKLIRETVLPSLRAFAAHHHLEVREGLRIDIIGPTMPGMVAWHFMVAPVMTRVFDLELDDAFYEAYAEQLTRFALHGLVGCKGDAER